jgi:hypothetical protein
METLVRRLSLPVCASIALGYARVAWSRTAIPWYESLPTPLPSIIGVGLVVIGVGLLVLEVWLFSSWSRKLNSWFYDRRMRFRGRFIRDDQKYPSTSDLLARIRENIWAYCLLMLIVWAGLISLFIGGLVLTVAFSS